MSGPANASSNNSNAAADQPALRICALLPEVESARACLEWAVAAARGTPAEIRAVHVGFDSHARASAEEVDIQQLRDLREGTPAARLARIRKIFEAFTASRTGGAPILWKNDEGDIGRGVVDEAKSADLIVIGRPMDLDGSDALHSALFDIRRLVLVTPRKLRDETSFDGSLGRHILVGWKPGEPIRHAVLAARPWLLRADRVSVIWVEKTGASYEQAARDFFAQVGIAAEMTSLKPDGRSVGRQLLAEAVRRGADSLLIGAFRHGVVWNAMLGGVTRDILAHAEIPVFLMR